MDCKTVHSKLIFYLEGSLGNEEAQQVESHLNSCAACKAFADDLKSTLSLIENEKKVEPGPYFYTRLKAKLETRGTASPALHLRRPMQILQPALFSLLLLLGIYAGFRIGQSGKTYQVAQNQEEIIPFLNEMETEPIETFLTGQNGN